MFFVSLTCFWRSSFASILCLSDINKSTFLQNLDKYNASVKALFPLPIIATKLSQYINVEKGVFGAEMLVSIQNDGPVTIILDTDNL